MEKEPYSAAKLYHTLLGHYGEQHWWPADTPYEVIVGAVLTQNTAWTNVKKALGNFVGGPSPKAVTEMDLPALIDIIRPAGFFNQKAVYLKAVTAWFKGYNFDADAVKSGRTERLRAELLAVKGIGRETADSILLYAFGLPSFVVDAYTFRLCGRLPLYAGGGYEAVKAYFEGCLPRDARIYNGFHALIVTHAKEHCRKKPLCGGCPLAGRCKRLGL
jgi:endonuclease-3 related protein